MALLDVLGLTKGAGSGHLVYKPYWKIGFPASSICAVSFSAGKKNTTSTHQLSAHVETKLEEQGHPQCIGNLLSARGLHLICIKRCAGCSCLYLGDRDVASGGSRARDGLFHLDPSGLHLAGAPHDGTRRCPGGGCCAAAAGPPPPAAAGKAPRSPSGPGPGTPGPSRVCVGAGAHPRQLACAVGAGRAGLRQGFCRPGWNAGSSAVRGGWQLPALWGSAEGWVDRCPAQKPFCVF